MEYLDGAGYFASLRGDLEHMMRMSNTHSFLQVRSIWIRLRRELQQIGFITPVEIEHAIFQTNDGNIDEVEQILLSEGYSKSEILRSFEYAFKNKFIDEYSDNLQVKVSRKN